MSRLPHGGSACALLLWSVGRRTIVCELLMDHQIRLMLSAAVVSRLLQEPAGTLV